MTWLGWVATAAGLLLLGAPVGVGAGRSGALVLGGRLADVAPARSGRRRPFGAPTVRVLIAGAAAAVAWIALAGGPLLAVAAGSVLVTGGVFGADQVRGRAAAARHRALLTIVGVLVGELEAGAQTADALAAAAGVEPTRIGVERVFVRAAAAAAQGDDAGAVLTADTDPDVRVLGLAWQLGTGTGAALANVLGRVAADLAAADEQRRTVSVALAGPRSSALLLSGLPLLGIALGAAMGARPLPFLIGDPTGQVLCCAGVLLDAGGLLWMRRILRSAARP